MSEVPSIQPSPRIPPVQKNPRRIPLRLLIVLAGFFGAVVGLGGFTFSYAQGFSYLSDDPVACINCHVMRDVYNAWTKGSHKGVATCSSCHTPHSSDIEKYAVKAINGFNHSVAFTFGNYPQPIRITKMNRDVAQANCIGCHAPLTTMINHAGNSAELDCLHCHSRVGHDE